MILAARGLLEQQQRARHLRERRRLRRRAEPDADHGRAARLHAVRPIPVPGASSSPPRGRCWPSPATRSPRPAPTTPPSSTAGTSTSPASWSRSRTSRCRRGPTSSRATSPASQSTVATAAGPWAIDLSHSDPNNLPGQGGPGRGGGPDRGAVEAERRQGLRHERGDARTRSASTSSPRRRAR